MPEHVHLPHHVARLTAVSAPTITASMRTGLADLELQRLDVIHGG
jgi:hypothetical protein